jgi:hypothetical protein
MLGVECAGLLNCCVRKVREEAVEVFLEGKGEVEFDRWCCGVTCDLTEDNY